MSGAVGSYAVPGCWACRLTVACPSAVLLVARADWVHRAPRTRAAVPAPNAGGVARSAVGATVGASAQYECAAPRGAGALPLGRVAGVRGGVGRVRTYRT